MEILFQVLQHGTVVFDLSFWREILSQVLFPMLDNIDLAIQTPIRKNDESGVQFYLQTIQQIVQGFNDFFVRNMDRLGYVIPSYADILVLFISQTQSRRIIQVLIVCFRQFMQTIASQLSGGQWKDLIFSFSLCFEASLPSGLERELDEFFGEQNQGKDDSKLDLALSRCMVQLFLINTIDNALEISYSKWTVEDTALLLRCLETSYKFSKTFNSRFELCIKLQRADQQAGL